MWAHLGGGYDSWHIFGYNWPDYGRYYTTGDASHAVFSLPYTDSYGSRYGYAFYY
jgi:hypothetical protein